MKSKRRRVRCRGKLARRRRVRARRHTTACTKTNNVNAKRNQLASPVRRARYHHKGSGSTGSGAGGSGGGSGETGSGTGTGTGTSTGSGTGTSSGTGTGTGSGSETGSSSGTGSGSGTGTGELGSTGLKPSNLTAPSISGGTVVGDTLSASTGSWSGSPVSYTYQWQRCEAGGAGCKSITGATGAGYVLTSADVGHTVTVVVTASNLSGSASSQSAATATISAATSTGGTQTNCISTPSSCGYPDATNSGVPAGASLSSATEERHVNTAGSTIKDLAVTGTIYVEANNVTIEDSEVIVNGSQSCSGSCGGKGIWIKPGVSGTKINHVTCRGGAASGTNVTQYCVQSNDAVTRVEDSRMYNCTECYTGPGEVVGSFLEDNGTISGEHYEDVYYGGGAGALIIEHDTMLNPHNQTAAVFASVDFGNQTTLRIENSLLAGGDYVIYGGGSGSGGTVVGPVSVKNDRFSRKFFPNGGSYGIDTYMNKSVTEWSGNYWDETLAPIAEE